MAASSDRTMIDGIYTDMIIGADTTTPAQRVNVTWGDLNSPIDENGFPVNDQLLIKTLIESTSKLICLNEKILDELVLLNNYNALFNNEKINIDDLN